MTETTLSSIRPVLHEECCVSNAAGVHSEQGGCDLRVFTCDLDRARAALQARNDLRKEFGVAAAARAAGLSMLEAPHNKTGWLAWAFEFEADLVRVQDACVVFMRAAATGFVQAHASSSSERSELWERVEGALQSARQALARLVLRVEPSQFLRLCGLPQLDTTDLRALDVCLSDAAVQALCLHGRGDANPLVVAARSGNDTVLSVLMHNADFSPESVDEAFAVMPLLRDQPCEDRVSRALVWFKCNHTSLRRLRQRAVSPVTHTHAQ
jgi:hypothetical protein